MTAFRPSSPSQSVKLLFFVLLLLPIMLLSAYSNSFEVPLALDDFHTFVDEPVVRIDTFDVDNLTRLGQSKFGWNRWIPMFTFSVDRLVDNGKVYVFHITNFLVHLFAFWGVIFLVFKILESEKLNCSSLREKKDNLYQAMSISLWIAGVWALHPLQTNAITYIVQRMASIVALFSILSIAFYIAGRLSYIKKRKTIYTASYILLSLFSTICAFFSKENSAIIPILILTTEIWFFQPDIPKKFFNYFRSRPVQLLLLLLSIGIPFLLYIPGWILGGYEGRHFTLTQRLLTESRVLVHYLSLLFWPDPRRLSLEHDVVVSTSLISPPSTVVSAVFLLTLLGWAVVKRRAYPVVTYGIVWFFLNLAIESTFIPLELMFEHRMYLPSIGILLSVVVSLRYLADWLTSRSSTQGLHAVPWCIFMVLTSVLTLATYERNTVWEYPLQLNSDNVAKAPENPRARSNYALALYRSGDYQEAIQQAREAMNLGVPHHEQYAVALNALISSYAASGEHQMAIEEGERLLAEGPRRMNVVPLPYVHYSLAKAKQTVGDHEGAFQSLVQGLTMIERIPYASPDVRVLGIRLMEVLLHEASGKGVDLDGDGNPDPGSLAQKAWVAERLLRMDQRHAARDLLHEALVMNPGDVESKTRLDELLAEDKLDAIQMEKKNFKEKYVRHPFTPFNFCMAAAFLIKKNQQAASLDAVGETLLDFSEYLKPGSPDVFLLRGWYHHDRGEAEEAVLAAKRALEIDPDYAGTWMGLGFFSMKANQPEQAIEAFKKTLDLFPHGPKRAEILAILQGLEAGVAGS